jgi:mono/diheme cytochrome c family protein
MKVYLKRWVSTLMVVGPLISMGLSSHIAIAQTVKLPANSSAQVVVGEKLYQQNCALCHGVNGRDANVFPRPIWGPGADLSKFSTTKGLFEYLQMLMPFDDPSKINDEQKTAIVAFMAVQHGASKPSESKPLGGNMVVLK